MQKLLGINMIWKSRNLEKYLGKLKQVQQKCINNDLGLCINGSR